MYDAIVVGARCAGAPLAMLLARAGHRVALVDRASFPSDTMSTHFLWQRGAARLQAWGLLGQLRDRGCAPVGEITFDVGPVQIAGIGPPVEGVADAYCPRRTVLDTLLAVAAAESGAELIEGFVVGDVLWSEGRAVGVRGHHRASPGSSLRARIVVGADGLHSTVARRVAACAYREYPPLTAVYYSYWSGIHLGASFHARPGRLILVWPTNDDLTCIYVAWPRQEFGQVRRDAENHFHSALGLVPGLRDTVASGRREARFTGTGDLPNLYRTSAGPGWALAGGGFDLTLTTARLAPLPSRLEAFYRTAAEQPEVSRQIFGVLGGSLPAADVYPDRHRDSSRTGARLPAAPRRLRPGQGRQGV